MPNSTQVKISVLDQFSPDVLGIFWITNEDLNRDLSNFEDFNYLFDGLISQYLYRSENWLSDLKTRHPFFIFRALKT